MAKAAEGNGEAVDDLRSNYAKFLAEGMDLQGFEDGLGEMGTLMDDFAN
jgi:hypothetical protein